MSLSRKTKLLAVARETCRELRRRSTQEEILLWRELRNRQFMGLKFRRQHPLFHDVLGMESSYVADFYCHEVNLVVEVDGEIHLKQQEADSWRSEVLNLLGVSVVRFTNDRVENNMEGVLEALRRTIEALFVRDHAPTLP